MTFDEWWKSLELPYVSFITDKQMAKDAWEAGWAEGLAEGYDVGYDDTGICPECLNEVRHKMDCGRGR